MNTPKVTEAPAPDKLDFTGLEFPIHPAADLLPSMSKQEFDGLVADIKKRGLVEPITTIGEEDSQQILEGRHRALACKVANYKPVSYRPYLGDDPYGYVLAKNIHRRHLDPEGKRKVIEALLKATPQKSNRQIAEQAKASHVTVGATRAKMESTGQIDQLTKTTGKDGKARKQPAKKKSAPRGQAVDEAPEPVTSGPIRKEIREQLADAWRKPLMEATEPRAGIHLQHVQLIHACYCKLQAASVAGDEPKFRECLEAMEGLVGKALAETGKRDTNTPSAVADRAEQRSRTKH